MNILKNKYRCLWPCTIATILAVATVLVVLHQHTTSTTYIGVSTEKAVQQERILRPASSVQRREELTGIEENKPPPKLLPDDLIYHYVKHINLIPIVNEEYNLIFFTVAKAAASQWTRFLMRLEGLDTWCKKADKEFKLHDRDSNGLKYLHHYPINVAQEMLTSPKWTRAIFVRNPKPRILSCFLDKSVKHGNHFEKNECGAFARDRLPNKKFVTDQAKLDGCIDNHKSFDYFLYNFTTNPQSHENVHVRSCLSFMSKKWWPYMNYIGTEEDGALASEAAKLLKSLSSNIDGVSAWDRAGKTGWGIEGFFSCESIGTLPFLGQRPRTIHAVHANEKMKQYYTPELERFVETHWADDFNNPYFKFEEIKLFPEDEDAEEFSDAE
mmetsp:Transcript_13844/g.20637  ORF Transcript_13844/g.20637 Transcript_13844/m.20637 type:complete len:383 (-) Transcript_13844:1196-2344(-)